MAKKNENIGVFSNISSSKNVTINLEDSLKENSLLTIKLNGTSQDTIVSNMKELKRNPVSSRTKIPAHIRRQKSFNFYSPSSNLNKLPGSNRLDMRNIRMWTDWRQKANLHMLTTIADEDYSGLDRAADFITPPIENEVIFNIYKTTRSAEFSSSVLGVKSFTMFGIPRINLTKESSNFHDDRDLHIEDLVSLPLPDYNKHTYCHGNDLLPAYSDIFSPSVSKNKVKLPSHNYTKDSYSYGSDLPPTYSDIFSSCMSTVSSTSC